MIKDEVLTRRNQKGSVDAKVVHVQTLVKTLTNTKGLFPCESFDWQKASLSNENSD